MTDMRDKLWQMKAVVFDTDGVITDTAGVHSEAWKEMFDDYLRERSRATGDVFQAFTEEDYLRYVDGKPRYDGVRSFLQSRGINLPEGSSDDPTSAETVRGLGNRKNDRFLQVLGDQGADPYPTTVELIDELHARHIATAVISSSRNCEAVLEAAGVRELFAVKVDGIDSARLGLAGKPAPDIFLEAARRLGVEPDRT
ncbi:MAG: HAD family hydrolase, partial [Acidimicrobiia bacterium]